MERSVKGIEDDVKDIRLNPRKTAERAAPNECMLLSQSSAAMIAAQLEIPEIQKEIERAVWQVERNIKAQENLQGANENNSSQEKAQKQEK